MSKATERLLPRFSLLTLMLVGTIAGLSLAVWKLGREVRPLRQEVKRLSDEVGELSIEDPTKIHAIRVKTYEDNVHRFRFHVPAENSYHLRKAAFNLPRFGVPVLPAVKRPDYPLEPGQYLVTIRMERRFNHETREPLSSVSFQMKIEPTEGQRFSASNAHIGVSEANNDWIVSKETGAPKFFTTGIQREQRVFEPDQPAVLLRIRAAKFKQIHRRDENGKPTSYSLGEIDEPCDGFMLWLEQWDDPNNRSE